MLTIGICDDDTAFIEELHTALNDIMNLLSDWQLRIYHDGDEVISDIATRHFDCDLLFMDIFMGKTSGIDVARYIHEHLINTDIIFITGTADYAFECYHYHSFSYLLKPVAQTTLVQELNRYFSDMCVTPKCLNIAIKGTHYRIPLRSILYIESEARKAIVHTTLRDYEYYQKLDYVEQQIAPYGFIRCHKSYLIPINKMSAYDGKHIYINDIAIPVSETYRDNVKDYFMQPEPGVTTALPVRPFRNSVTGALVCTKGVYTGSIIRMYPGKKLMIGRDGTECDIVINLPHISRRHCQIIFHAVSNTYEITDFSHNGTFYLAEEILRLPQGRSHVLQPGATLYFGDFNTIYRLI